MNTEPSEHDLIYRDHPPIHYPCVPTGKRGIDFDVLKQPLSDFRVTKPSEPPHANDTPVLLEIFRCIGDVIFFLGKAALVIVACVLAPIALVLIVLVPGVALTHIASVGTPSVLLLIVIWYLFKGDKST